LTEVTLVYPDGARRDVLLLDIPRKGDSVRPKNGGAREVLMVEHVMWEEGQDDPPDPTVLVNVRPMD
jgi:hypothetical protein